MKRMQGGSMREMRNSILGLLFIFIAIFSMTAAYPEMAGAAVEWEVIKTLNFEEQPLDIANSLDGSKAYILSKKCIYIYSVERGEITDKIPVADDFSRISVSPDGESLFLASTDGKKMSIIKVSSVFDIPIGDSPVIGDKNAPVRIVAFLDYQCPYCTSMYPLIEQLLEKYPKKVCLIIKQFPLRMHAFAEKAAMAALAAAKQNKYRELSSLYFKNYKSLNDQTIKEYAQQAGLNIEAFDKDRGDNAVRTIITEDTSLGKKLGIRGVPAVFINGRAFRGRSVDALSQQVEQELKKTAK
jgi:protein-disulfide isomerase